MKHLSTSACRRVAALLGRIGLASLGVFAAQAQGEVRIAQVYASGGAAGALYARDFVELYNSGAAQDLSGWSLQYASASGSTWNSAALPALVLAPGERLLVRFSGDFALGTGQAPDVAAFDADHPAALAPAGGKLALCASTAPLTGAQPTSATIVDFLGWGSANWREPFVGGSSLNNAPALNSAVALLRAECGGRDVESNALDFQLALPRPRGRTSNSSSGIDVGVFVTPRLARPLDSVLLVAAPLDCAAGALSAPWLLSVDASALGLGSAVPLNDAGLFGDALAGDGLYSRSFSLPAALAPGDLTLAVSASDGARTSLARAALVVLPASVPGVDACASAEVVSGPFPLTRVGSLAAANSETNPLLHASSSVSTMGARRGHWLRVLGNGSTLSADTCLSAPLGLDAPDTVLLVATGSCGALSVVGFGDDQVSLCGAGFGPERRSRVDWCAAAGQEYFVWVAAFNPGGVPLNYELRISDLGPVCTPSVGGALCAPDFAGVVSFERESPLGPARNDLCLGGNEPELLEASSPARVHRGHARAFGAHVDVDAYRVFAPVSELYRATLDAPFRARLELYQLGAGGACPLGALLTASALSERCEPMELQHPLVAGAWYALVVRPQNSADPAWLGGFEPGGASSAYTLTTELGSAPPNDACGNAAQLTCGVTAAGTTWGARPEATGLLNACGGPGDGTSGSYAIDQPGVWYRVQAPAGADSALFVEIESAVFDSRLAVFSGACNSLVCLTANDDIDASGRSKVGWRAQAGATYRVLVHGADAVRGPFTISARCEALVDGDECGLGVLIDGLSGAAQLSTLGATGANTSYPLGGAGGLTPCLANGPSTSSYFDVWLRFDAPCDGLVQFEACAPNETVLSVHADCASAVDPFVLACSDAGGLTCAPGASVSFVTAAGARYRLRVAARDGAQDGGPVTLSWSYADADADGTPDCSDECPNDPLKVAPGVCGCGVSDVDSDGDGAANCIDGCPNDPLKLSAGVCGCGVSDVDSDGDGTANCIDGCPNDPLKLAPGVCGCGVSDVDSDGDGVADCNDGCPTDPLKLSAGVCGCGVSDVDSDGDGVADCNDGCPNDPLKLAPGVCGCGVSDVDSDGDGVANCLDNCVPIANPAQSDCDLDGVGDACEIGLGGEPDTDQNGVPDSCQFGALVNYCTGGTSSQGCVGAMGGHGVPSVSSDRPFLLQASGVDGQRAGLIFYGVNGPANATFAFGLLCVKAPIQRSSALQSGGTAGVCNGRLTLDWTGFQAANVGLVGAPFQAGDLVWSQAWWRDPQSPSGARGSDALQFTLAP